MEKADRGLAKVLGRSIARTQNFGTAFHGLSRRRQLERR